MKKKLIIAFIIPLALALGLAWHFNKVEYSYEQPEIEVDTRDSAQKVADNGAELSRLLKAQNEHTRGLRDQKVEAELLVIELEEMIASSTAEAENIQEQINEVAWQLKTLGM